ncbi:MAG: methylenetetrahydrofolate--tRNA-(uracil(54)-C(5))-methyltransferase (FADH(2)-oxidizing) TrmFO [Christensenellales bacterium]|jgi:methylenetetrahydrofolate--tRNA-(uracil-5-)-methyltransferase
MQKNNVTVVGAGLAGCEAAWQLAKRGIPVTLYEMKPKKFTPAHKSEDFAELVCSNSFRGDRLQNAVGLLKEELRRLDSLIMRCADETRVPAGGALAVDREGFSRAVTERVKNHPLITVVSEEVESIPEAPAIVATGPLTSEPLAKSIAELFGEGLYFFDAAAPIVTYESLNMEKVFRQSRYDKGGEDYLNCPMTREEYFAFLHELRNAETAHLKDFEDDRVFEGCMPVEVMAKRGDMTLAFGPLKPKGLTDPRTGKRPFAVVQLRQDDEQGTLFNIVGFQTHLKFPEQKRVFSMIPGLENAEFVRYGVMHRNTFIHSPGNLNPDFSVIRKPGLYFAGQMTGVEGYVESTASGLVAGISMAKRLNGEEIPDFTRKTAVGALGYYISSYSGADFQPMNITFGIIEPLEEHIRQKSERYTAISERALSTLEEIIKSHAL